MQKQSYIFIGRAGAGKGTQAKHLIDALNRKDGRHSIVSVETGAEFRKFIQGDSHTAKLGKDIVETGALMPAFMPVFLWATVLIKGYTGQESIIFDGTPRLLMEAKMLDSIFPFYGLGKPWVIYLDIDHEESAKRLTIRAKEGRKDDDPQAIERRRTAFEQEVKPTVEYYREHPGVNFLDIDGARAIDEVHADIVKRIGL